jgi:hypothetical protein
VIVSSLTGYALLTSLLMTLAGGRVVVALEGGYNLKSISTSMEAVVRTLLGDPLPRFERTPEGPAFTAVRKPALQAIHDTMQALSQYWPVFLRTLAVFDSQPQLYAPASAGMTATFAASDDEDDESGDAGRDEPDDDSGSSDSQQREPASKRPRADADSGGVSPL